MLLPDLLQASLNLLFFLPEGLSQCSGSQLQLSSPHLLCHTGPAARRSKVGQDGFIDILYVSIWLAKSHKTMQRYCTHFLGLEFDVSQSYIDYYNTTIMKTGPSHIWQVHIHATSTDYCENMLVKWIVITWRLFNFYTSLFWSLCSFRSVWGRVTHSQPLHFHPGVLQHWSVVRWRSLSRPSDPALHFHGFSWQKKERIRWREVVVLTLL